MAPLSHIAFALTVIVPVFISSVSSSKDYKAVYPSSCSDDHPSGKEAAVYLDFFDDRAFEMYHVCTTVGRFCSKDRECIESAMKGESCPVDPENGWKAPENVFCDLEDGVCKARPQDFPGSQCGCLMGCFEATQWSSGKEMGCIKGSCTILEDVRKDGL